ncbi:MAG: hypothetical protein HY840_10925 [Bacteroidetes bacterium]|nr:hypothetical protein [Bacteroidota bacterium]
MSDKFLKYSFQKKIHPDKLCEIINQVTDKIIELKINNASKEFILYSINELASNINEHAKSTSTSLKLHIDKGFFTILITDNGIGIKNTYLAKSIIPKDDIAAIEYALSGLSTKNQKERGYGLYSIRKITNHLEGKMIVESGKGRIISTKNTSTSETAKKRIKGVRVFVNNKIRNFDFYKLLS